MKQKWTTNRAMWYTVLFGVLVGVKFISWDNQFSVLGVRLGPFLDKARDSIMINFSFSS